MAIELATKYEPYVDEIFTTESKKEVLTNQDFEWTGAKTVKIYKITTAEMNDYARNGDTAQSRYGKAKDLNATTQEMTLKKDRSFTYVIDRLDSDETVGALQASSSLARQVREVVVPEVDSYTYSVMCEKAGTKPDPIQLTSNNIYDGIIEASRVMDNAEVPETNRIIVVTPDSYHLMKKCKDIIMETDISTEMRLRGVVGLLDGAAVMKIPAPRLPKGFGFMMAHSVATVAPTKLEDYKIHDNPPGISGHLVEGRICYDAFVLDNKVKAIYYQSLLVEAE